MSKSDSLPAELGFLADILSDRAEQYKNPEWLNGQFLAKIWTCRFGNMRLLIDFRVELDDRSLLTDAANHELCTIFKYWICIQTHPDLTGGKLTCKENQRFRVIRAIQLIDYFLMNAHAFKLAKHGVSLVTEDDLKHLIYQLVGHKDIAQAIYRWDVRLTEHLKKHGAALTSDELNQAIAECPEIADIKNIDRSNLTIRLSDEELIRARAFLWINDLYKKLSRVDYRHTPSTLSLAQQLYPNTLRGKNPRPIANELCLSPFERYYREYPAIPVRTGTGNRRTKHSLEEYLCTLRSLGLLGQINLPVPLDALELLSLRGFVDTLSTNKRGRTRTLPQTVVFRAIRNAIEFFLEFGADLVESYVDLLRAASRLDISVALYCNRYGITSCLTPKLQAAGVSTWHLGQCMSMHEANPAKISSDRPPASEYFRRMRSNEGFWELMKVLSGAILLCVGALMARRRSELTDLKAGQCLDTSRQYLIFKNRKSGILDIRETEARPIPPIAVNMINLLETFQQTLVDAGYLKELTFLFSWPDQFGNMIFSKNAILNSVDIFCDYFETTTNSLGQRYYIRQHQLRRFFAMLFFWGHAFGGLDTLRWFLGHTDAEHLYHYITETTSGEVLLSVKATYATDLLLQKAPDLDPLADLLEIHFGTRNFSVLDSEEVEDYLQDLIEEGIVKIEPHFFSTSTGQSYKVLIIVRRNSNDDSINPQSPPGNEAKTAEPS